MVSRNDNNSADKLANESANRSANRSANKDSTGAIATDGEIEKAGQSDNGVADVANSASVDSLSSPMLNIPNHDNNYHWFLGDDMANNLSNKQTITPSTSESSTLAINGSRIWAGMSIKHIVNRILKHIGH